MNNEDIVQAVNQIQETGLSELERIVEELDLSPDAIDLLIEVLQEIQKYGYSPLLDQIRYADYRFKPVSIREFVLSPYYLNKAKYIRPKLLKELENFFNGDYIIALLTGSIGWGKTTFGIIAKQYIFYKLFILRNPQEYYGLDPSTEIALVNFSVNLKTAMTSFFNRLKNDLMTSPFFKHFILEGEIDIKKEEIRTNNNIILQPLPISNEAISLNVFSAVIDEANFLGQKRKGNEVFDIAEELFDSLYRRLESRFQQKGRVPGKLMILSSAKYPEDFTERMIREFKGNPMAYIRRYAIYDVKSGYESSKRFRVCLGSLSHPPRIIDSEKDCADCFIAKGKTYQNCGFERILVPEEFRFSFERNIEKAIRDIAGRPVLTTAPFFHNRESILNCIDPDKKHPFSKEVSVELGDIQIDYEKMNLDRSLKRYIHIDLGVTGDATGIAMVHFAGFKKVKRLLPDGTEHYEELPIAEVDFVLRVVPKSEIPISRIREFIYTIVEKHGLYVRRISYDQFQSRESIQQFKQRGYNAERISVDATLEPYMSLKEAFFDRRIILYHYEPLLQELFALEFDGRKVDHPPDGSKDVADALCGAVYSCFIDNQISKVIEPSVGEHEEEGEEEEWWW